MATNFIEMARKALAQTVSGPINETRAAMDAAIAEYEDAHRRFTAQRVHYSTKVFTSSDPYSRQAFLDGVKKLENLRQLAELAKVGRNNLAHLSQVSKDIERHMHALAVGERVIDRIIKAQESEKALGKFTLGSRPTTLDAQRKSLLLHVDEIVRLLQEAGWRPSASNHGVIGAERKRLGALVKKAA